MKYSPGVTSLHFSWQEVISSATASRLGISNIPPISVYPAIANTSNCLEVIRSLLNNKPLQINSWFRCLELNRALGSKDSSQHVLGEAVDFICPSFGSPLDICKAIIKSKISFDQLILEHTWVHVSFKSNPNAVNRCQVLSLLENNSYAKGLTDKQGNKL